MAMVGTIPFAFADAPSMRKFLLLAALVLPSLGCSLSSLFSVFQGGYSEGGATDEDREQHFEQQAAGHSRPGDKFNLYRAAADQ